MSSLDWVRAVLFDMDGTLVDSNAAVERAWETWARHYNVDESLVLADVHGNPAEITVRRVAPHLSDEAVDKAARFQLGLQYSDLDDVAATPGATAVVDVLAQRRMAWAVVTTADRRLATARLGAAGIQAPVLITSEDVTQGKPHPEGFLKAASELGVRPADCLVVEDSSPGVAAGLAAGMQVAALRGLHGDLSITDLGQLAAWLQPSQDLN